MQYTSWRWIIFLVLSLNLTAVILGLLVYWRTEYSLFSEGGVITLVSVFQLGVIARLSWKIMQTRGAAGWLPVWREPNTVWWLIAIGFVFLAADELLKIHESIDTLIHYVFDLEKTAITDRIDDILVGIYGLVGIGVLIVYRKELKPFGEAILYLVAGFTLMFAMVALDVITNKKDILVLFFQRDTATVLRSWLSLVEDSLKMLAEAFFLLGFIATLRKATLIARNGKKATAGISA